MLIKSLLVIGGAPLQHADGLGRLSLFLLRSFKLSKDRCGFVSDIADFLRDPIKVFDLCESEAKRGLQVLLCLQLGSLRDVLALHSVDRDLGSQDLGFQACEVLQFVGEVVRCPLLVEQTGLHRRELDLKLCETRREVLHALDKRLQGVRNQVFALAHVLLDYFQALAQAFNLLLVGAHVQHVGFNFLQDLEQNWRISA